MYGYALLNLSKARFTSPLEKIKYIGASIIPIDMLYLKHSYTIPLTTAVYSIIVGEYTDTSERRVHGGGHIIIAMTGFRLRVVIYSLFLLLFLLVFRIILVGDRDIRRCFGHESNIGATMRCC